MFDFKKHTVVVIDKAATYYLLLKKWVGFVFLDGPGKSTRDCEANAGQLLCRNKNKQLICR